MISPPIKSSRSMSLQERLQNDETVSYSSNLGIQRPGHTFQETWRLLYRYCKEITGWRQGRVRCCLARKPRTAARRNGSFNPALAGSNLWYNPAGVSDPNANITRTTSYAFGDKPAYEADDRAFGYLEEDFGLIKRTFITEP